MKILAFIVILLARLCICNETTEVPTSVPALITLLGNDTIWDLLKKTPESGCVNIRLRKYSCTKNETCCGMTTRWEQGLEFRFRKRIFRHCCPPSYPTCIKISSNDWNCKSESIAESTLKGFPVIYTLMGITLIVVTIMIVMKRKQDNDNSKYLVLKE